MQELMNENVALLEDHDFSFVAGSPTVYHCHHYNLFFDQTVDDAVGPDRGIEVRTQAAYEASSQFLNALINAIPPTSPEERLDIAKSVFSTMGQGTLTLNVTPDGGTATGTNLHYGFAWREKYGSHIRRQHPADAFAAGFIAAATEAAYGLPFGSVECRETGCIAMGQETCTFEVSPSGQTKTAFGVTQEDIVGTLPKTFKGQHEDHIEKVTNGLREFLAGVRGDSRGLIEAFGVMVTQHLANYYNHCSNRTLDIINSEKPEAIEVARELFRESGHQCGFHTFGGILLSPEWEALVGPLSGDPTEVITGRLAISRALGFGHWALESYEPNKSLIFRSPATYESVYRKAAYPLGDSGCCFLYQGAGLAVMQLAHRIEWSERPTLSNNLYLELRQGVPWTVNESHCVAKGNAMCRVVVQ
ncbi:4-vinyl reductase 4VR [Haliangium ochraceum]|uniref:4-vinyl reductase 4VR n=1 Tax=Haliangium ochraceum (strain DSM 14365 / JCM 11303 / SMP-2) TaxID=502025 RepID=D0LUG6_HALO1|nr:4-vinyl reductase 4VR [Haliangium ochraceum]ACY19289.1 4-vinyl reductase 4VR [Haliangium ochraceum DSM 14365]